MDSARLAWRVALGSLAAGCLLALGVMQSQRYTQMGVLPTESGRVQYRFSKPGLQGTSQFTWIEHGAMFRQDVQGSRSETILGRGTVLFTLNPGFRRQPATAQRTVVKPTDVWLNAEEMPHITLGSGAGELVGTGTVLGKPCEIRKLHTMRIWYWQGLPLRMERPATAGMRPLSLVAAQLDTDVYAPRSQFQIPPGYTITDFPGRAPGFPWTTLAAMSLIGLLLILGICAWLLESAYAQRHRMAPATS